MIQQDVGRLQISMGVALLVDVAEPAQELFEEVATSVLTKRARALDVIHELSSKDWFLSNIGHPALLTVLVFKNSILIVHLEASYVLMREIIKCGHFILK